MHASAEPPRIPGATTLHYSPYFKLVLPTEMLTDAKILPSAGPLIKFSDSMMLGGTITTKEQDELPKDFDLHLYPRYLLGLEPTDSLPPKLSQSFDNSRPAFGITPGAAINETPYGKGLVYSACDPVSCLIFVIQHQQNEQILMLNTKGFDLTSILSYLENNDAE